MGVYIIYISYANYSNDIGYNLIAKDFYKNNKQDF